MTARPRRVDFETLASTTGASALSSQQQQQQQQKCQPASSKSKFAKSSDSKSDFAYRVEIKLFPDGELNDDEHRRYEYSFLDLIGKAASTKPDQLAEPLPLHNGGGSSNGNNNGSADPFAAVDSAEDDRLRSIAQSLEARYGPQVYVSKGGRRQRRICVQDYMDPGEGYDSEDSFIDDGDARELMVLPNQKPKLGGFYINQGDLEVTTDNASDIVIEGPASADGSTPSGAARPAAADADAASKKRRRDSSASSSSSSSSSDSSSSSVDSSAGVAKKRRKHQQQLLPDRPSLFGGGANKSKSKMSPGRRDLVSKAVKTLTKAHRRQKTTTAAANATAAVDLQMTGSVTPLKPPATVQQQAAASQNPAQPIRSIDHIIDRVLADSPSPAKPAANVNPLKPSLDSIFDSVVLGNEKVSAQQQQQQSKLPNQAKPDEAVPNLPPNLPPPILQIVDRIKEAKRKSSSAASANAGGGKLSQLFASNDLASDWLALDDFLRSGLPSAQCNAVYSHLAGHLGLATKVSLRRKILKLRENRSESQLQVLLTRLRELVQSAMPEQLARHAKETRLYRERIDAWRQQNDAAAAAATAEGRPPPSPSVAGKPPGPQPRRNFVWCQKSTELLNRAARIKLEALASQRIKESEREDAIKEFAEKQLVPLWPADWMSCMKLMSIIRPMLKSKPSQAKREQSQQQRQQQQQQASATGACKAEPRDKSNFK
ncbi:hypothetical protein BOX15_Mlig017182g1 [Macrostomum lignano]|uniref:Hpc2-related domain-containing protein n=1 Tax=Macrostomum lignano TaxID=282301 RepID=A0A267GH58_9PLAT|nr:hypothetical protein BOX15_Mlig017182g1 [Macrostomum lignano]